MLAILSIQSQSIIVSDYARFRDFQISLSQSLEVCATRLLSSRHFSPQVFATFGNGYVFDSTLGSPLNYDACIDRNVYPYVAHRIGENVVSFSMCKRTFFFSYTSIVILRTVENLVDFFCILRSGYTGNLHKGGSYIQSDKK